MMTAKMGLSNFFTFFVLLSALCFHWPPTQAIQLNLAESCAKVKTFFCTIANISDTLEDPLILVNVTAPELYELVLRDSIVPRIPSTLLAQAPALRSFFMHNCSLNRLTAYDFPTDHPLRFLGLQNNRLSVVPEKVFIAIYRLEELQLGRNTIHMVHRNAFAGLVKLRYLDLQQNSICELPNSLFDALINVEHIDLSSNNIEKIDVNTFKCNTKLQTLLLGDNRFVLFEPDALAHLPRFHLLDISSSNVTELRLQSVDTLSVQGSALQSIAIAGSALKVHAGNNHLTSLNISDKLSVRELDLHGNQLESLEDLVGMWNLQRLDVSRNQLRSLSTSASPLHLPLANLVHLNLAFNQLQNLTLENFLELQKLTYLDLAFNHLLHLDQQLFEPMANLEKFYIEGNRLHIFDYEKFVATHKFLREFGIFENEWENRDMRKMFTYLQEHNIQLPVRFTSSNNNSNSTNNVANLAEATLNSLSTPDKSVHHRHASTISSIEELDKLHAGAKGSRVDNVSGIHPYWTMRDVFTVVILLLVLMILFLQLFTILREEECLTNCCNRLTRNGQRGERRLLTEDEEDSEV